MKLAFIIIVTLSSIAGASVYAVFQQPQFGGVIAGMRLERIKKSPLYSDDRLQNIPPQSLNNEWLKLIRLYMKGQVREPQFEVPVVPVDVKQLENDPSSGLLVTWLGHASVIIEIGGRRLMVDPVLSDVVSPVPYIYGPKRLHAAPIAIKNLKRIDAVLISHDHYDHLDMQTVQALGAQGTRFFVPLGVGAHLERWGIATNQIQELEWWESTEFGSLQIYCTPARHYSGRKSTDNSTLWASWLIKSRNHSVYFSGDTGYSPHFSEIKKRLGPVDLTLMKIGAYGDTAGWLDIHMTPESAVQAHRELGGAVMLPVHWATFNLAYHAWQEPIERTLQAARLGNAVKVVTPRIGEQFDIDKPYSNTAWYKR